VDVLNLIRTAVRAEGRTLIGENRGWMMGKWSCVLSRASGPWDWKLSGRARPLALLRGKALFY